MGVISNGTTLLDSGSLSSGLSGSMTLIKTLTASSSGTLSFVNGASNVVLDNTYKEYIFTFKYIHPSAGTVGFYFNGSADTGSNYTASFSSTMNVNTKEYRIRVGAGEFCSTPNHTIFTGWGQNDYHPVSGTLIELGDQFTSSAFLPYVTTIGLYDDNKLVAVGKLANPHKRSLSENITYVLKFDI